MRLRLPLSHSMKLNEMKQWLMRFSAMDRDKDGYISVEDMARYLKVPNDACLQGVFNALEPVCFL